VDSNVVARVGDTGDESKEVEGEEREAALSGITASTSRSVLFASALAPSLIGKAAVESGLDATMLGTANVLLLLSLVLLLLVDVVDVLLFGYFTISNSFLSCSLVCLPASIARARGHLPCMVLVYVTRNTKEEGLDANVADEFLC
jgi:hypothetical protein